MIVFVNFYVVIYKIENKHKSKKVFLFVIFVTFLLI